MANEEHLRKLREGVETWNAWLAEQPEGFRADLSGANLGGADLKKVNLFGANLGGADLNEADLFKANLNESKIDGANLDRAKIDGADLNGADLNGANLIRANLIRANLIGANLIGANLKWAKLDRADLNEGDLFGADLSGADLSGADLNGARFEVADLSGADLSGADLNRAKLGGADLSGAKLNGAKLNGAKLNSAYLNRAHLFRADLSEAKLRGANLREADLREADLREADLREADFSDADLRWCRNLELDGNVVRNARFSPNAQDPWSILRRTYTGMNFALILLFLVVFAIPYILNAGYWHGVNQAQGAVESVLLWAENNPDNAPNLPSDMATDEVGLYKTPCLTANETSCRQFRVWQLLIGVHKGFWYWLLALGLILYNVLLYIITVQVNAFREEEERSGHAPELKAKSTGPWPWSLPQGYKFYYQLHQVARILFALSVISFFVHLLPTLALPVSVATGGG